MIIFRCFRLYSRTDLGVRVYVYRCTVDGRAGTTLRSDSLAFSVSSGVPSPRRTTCLHAKAPRRRSDLHPTRGRRRRRSAFSNPVQTPARTAATSARVASSSSSSSFSRRMRFRRLLLPGSYFFFHVSYPTPFPVLFLHPPLVSCTYVPFCFAEFHSFHTYIIGYIIILNYCVDVHIYRV